MSKTRDGNEVNRINVFKYLKMKHMISYIKRNVLIILSATFCLSAFPTNGLSLSREDTLEIRKESAIQVAYGVQPEWMVTGAVSSVSGDVLQSSFTQDFSSRLFARIPGLTITASGTEPGSQDNSLYGRGINTFGIGSNNMLILVDGIEANYSDLVPEEIESVTLLKDASATAMYGGRAANGVLLVTTKRGQTGDLKVNFSTQHGFQSATHLPQFLGSYDYARLFNEARVNDGRDERYTSEELELFRSGDDPYFYPDVNWYDHVLRETAPINSYNLTFSGGSQAARYFLLVNHASTDKMLRATGSESEFSEDGKYRRFNFRSNVDIDITQSLTADITLGGSVVNTSNPSRFNTGGLLGRISNMPPNLFPVYNPNGTWSRSSLFANPLGDMLETGFQTSNGRTLQASIGLTQKLDFITEGLSLTGRVTSNSFFIGESNKVRTYASYAISKSPEGDTIYTPYGLNSSLTGEEGGSAQNRTFAFQSFLNYDRSFGRNMLDGVILFNIDDYVTRGNTASDKYVNLSGRLTYAYDQRYIAEFSGSYMGSRIFPEGNRYGFFPAGSVGWILSNEGFLRDNNVVNFLKLRGSYGIVGNSRIGGWPPYKFIQFYPGGGAYRFGTDNSNYPSIVQGRAANPFITWEKEKSMNLGLEVTLINRLDIEVDIFNRNRYDILVTPDRSDPDFMGYEKPYMNEGETNNKGMEGRFRFYNDTRADFNFYMEATAWYYTNELVFSSEQLRVYDYLQREGQPIGQPFGLEAIGFFRDEEDIASSPLQAWTEVRPGDVKYKDQNGDGIIDENDLFPIGNTGIPNFTGGLNLGFNYRGFDFDVFFQGVTGRTVNLMGNYFHAFQNEGQAGTIALNRWTEETAETATYPRLSSMNNQNNFRYSSQWQYDGSFIKLRSIELGYTIPSGIGQAVNLEHARVFINGTNLLSFDHMNGYRDPEYGPGYPPVRTYSMGVRVQFQ